MNSWTEHQKNNELGGRSGSKGVAQRRFVRKKTARLRTHHLDGTEVAIGEQSQQNRRVSSRSNKGVKRKDRCVEEQEREALQAKRRKVRHSL